MSEGEIARLRQEVAEVDREIVALVAKRVHLAGRIGMEKRSALRPMRDSGVEEQVRSRIGEASQAWGLSESLAGTLARSLIEESVRRQEHLQRLTQRAEKALVIGGAGRMGRWACRYLRSRGFAVTANDVAGPLEGFAFEVSLVKAVPGADIILVSVPVTAAAGVLETIAALAPKGLILDICSVKASIRDQLRAMAVTGLRVASVHPMFGPEFWPMSEGTILFSDCGNAAALREAKELFRETSASYVDVSLEDHDERIAYLLGLSHLTLLAFARVVAGNPFATADLKRFGGTTFSRLSRAAQILLGDSPELLRDIQAINPYTSAIHRSLREALDDWRRASEDSDGKEFVGLIQHTRSFLGGTSA